MAITTTTTGVNWEQLLATVGAGLGALRVLAHPLFRTLKKSADWRDAVDSSIAQTAVTLKATEENLTKLTVLVESHLSNHPRRKR